MAVFAVHLWFRCLREFHIRPAVSGPSISMGGKRNQEETDGQNTKKTKNGSRAPNAAPRRRWRNSRGAEGGQGAQAADHHRRHRCGHHRRARQCRRRDLARHASNNPVAQMSIDEATPAAAGGTKPATSTTGGILISKDGYDTAVRTRRPCRSMISAPAAAACTVSSTHAVTMMEAARSTWICTSWRSWIPSTDILHSGGQRRPDVDNDDDPGHLLTFKPTCTPATSSRRRRRIRTGQRRPDPRAAIAAGVPGDVADKMATDKYTEWLTRWTPTRPSARSCSTPPVRSRGR